MIPFALGLACDWSCFGLAPTLEASRGQLADGLREGGRSHIGGASRLRALLVSAQVALSVMLLVGGMLLFRSFVRLPGIDPGLDWTGVLTFRLALPGRVIRKLHAASFSRGRSIRSNVPLACRWRARPAICRSMAIQPARGSVPPEGRRRAGEELLIGQVSWCDLPV